MTVLIPHVALYILLTPLLLLVAGCSTAPKLQGDTIEEAFFTPEQILGGGVTEIEDEEISDPFEGFNRTMYRFNYYFDKYVFLPAVIGYMKITPDAAQDGIHNFFRNIQDITTLFNSILQLNPEKTLNTTTRLLVNTTIGLLGFIDIANDVPRKDEDFGQTLGYWGVGSGPYLVLPVLGPSSVRDGIGQGVDWYVGYDQPKQRLTNMEAWQETTLDIVRAIDLRAHVRFLYYETNSPFEYEMVRMLWTTKRKLDIKR
ncbi:MAG TPA: VacJ family lipoprotein [Gammaproteobacteria bacterium]|nr:VacJ family lipoprotein [Gammaproteobacteria bacterium]